MEQIDAEKLANRVSTLRREVEALISESQGIPALWRNGIRLKACVRMMEIDLGLPLSIPEQDG